MMACLHAGNPAEGTALDADPKRRESELPFGKGVETAFADGYPFLLATEARAAPARDFPPAEALRWLDESCGNAAGLRRRCGRVLCTCSGTLHRAWQGFRGPLEAASGCGDLHAHARACIMQRRGLGVGVVAWQRRMHPLILLWRARSPAWRT